MINICYSKRILFYYYVLYKLKFTIHRELVLTTRLNLYVHEKLLNVCDSIYHVNRSRYTNYIFDQIYRNAFSASLGQCEEHRMCSRKCKSPR